jgi:hypothetical protein
MVFAEHPLVLGKDSAKKSLAKYEEIKGDS